MKILTLIAVLGGLMLSSGGCASTAYSASERDAKIARAWNIDGHQIVDDFDSLLLLHPPSRMTIWHVR
jgi:hypothetical protein